MKFDYLNFNIYKRIYTNTLTSQEIKNIIHQLDNALPAGEFYFELHKTERTPTDNFIKADKNGLIACASELLKAASMAEDLPDEEVKKTIDTNFNGVDFIELNKYPPKREDPIAYPKTIGDVLIPAGCLLVALFITASLITGFVTIFKWIF